MKPAYRTEIAHQRQTSLSIFGKKEFPDAVEKASNKIFVCVEKLSSHITNKIMHGEHLG